MNDSNAPGGQEHRWHISRGALVGPVTARQIVDAIRADKMQLTDQVMREGGTEWQRASDVPEVAALFDSLLPATPSPAAPVHAPPAAPTTPRSDRRRVLLAGLAGVALLGVSAVCIVTASSLFGSPNGEVSPTTAPSAALASDAGPAEVSPEPEPEPDPVRLAMDEGRFEVVCVALVSEGFSDHVCAFLVARARGERGSLNQRTLERFLRGQQVRRVRGRILGIYETGSYSVTYEARIGGRTSLLETTDTTFTTTGGFSIWAQRTPNDEEIVLVSGRVQNIPAYVEWKLADDLLDLARQRSGGQSTARRMLDDLILDWGIQWRHEDTDVADVEAEEGL